MVNCECYLSLLLFFIPLSSEMFIDPFRYNQDSGE